MRCSLSFILLPVLLFQTVLLSPLMEITLQEHQEEVKERLRSRGQEEELLELSFSRNALKEELEWKDEREFAYRGKMYDIVDIEKDGERFLLTVYKDEQETEMKEEFQTLLKGSAENEDQENRSSLSKVQPFKYLRQGGNYSPSPIFSKELGQGVAFPFPERIMFAVPLPPPCYKASFPPYKDDLCA